MSTDVRGWFSYLNLYLMPSEMPWDIWCGPTRHVKDLERCLLLQQCLETSWRPWGTSTVAGYLCLAKRDMSKISASGLESIQHVKITDSTVGPHRYSYMVVTSLSSRLELDGEPAPAPRMLTWVLSVGIHLFAVLMLWGIHIQVLPGPRQPWLQLFHIPVSSLMSRVEDISFLLHGEHFKGFASILMQNKNLCLNYFLAQMNSWFLFCSDVQDFS